VGVTPPDGTGGPGEIRGRPHVAVVGSGTASPELAALARAVGRAVASAGAVVVCGGLGGVMAAACEGAKEVGGLTVGIVPGTDRHDAAASVDVVVATGMGEARNVIVVHSADAVVAVGGEFGTLSEIALALRAGIPVVGLRTWELRRDGQPVFGVIAAEDPVEAVETALRLAGQHSGDS